MNRIIGYFGSAPFASGRSGSCERGGLQRRELEELDFSEGTVRMATFKKVMKARRGLGWVEKAGGWKKCFGAFGCQGLLLVWQDRVIGAWRRAKVDGSCEVCQIMIFSLCLRW